MPLKDKQHRSFTSSPLRSRTLQAPALRVSAPGLVWKHSPSGGVLSMDSGSQGLVEAPHCFLKLSPGQRVARAKASLSERCTQPFPGELSCPAPRAAAWGRELRGRLEMGGREEVGLTQQDSSEVVRAASRREQRCWDLGARWGPRVLAPGWQ